MAKILLVDDDSDISDSISEWLKSESHKVEIASTGLQALELLQFNKYDVIVLDVGLPDLDGFSVCKRHRANKGTGMILMLTGLDSVEDKMQGLDSGADDYVSKPFQLKEVSARIRALLRRVSRAQRLTCGHLTVDLARHEATIKEEKLDLFPKEFALLAFLVENPGKVHSVNRILREVWSDTEEATENAVRTCIARLRKQLEDASMPGLIVTVPGSGYRLDLPD